MNEVCETQLKEELKQVSNRHARKLIQKLSEVVNLPTVAHDSIRQEMEYSTLDGYRTTMKHNRKGSDDEQGFS